MRVVDRLSEKMLPVMSKVSSQRHLLAIRDNFIVTMPLVVATSATVLSNALIFSNATVQRILDLNPLTKLAPAVNSGTISTLTITVCYNIGWNLATHYIQTGMIDDPSLSLVHAGVLSTAVTFTLMSLSSTITLMDGDTAEATRVFLQNLTSSSGLTTAMIVALVSTELFIELAKMKSSEIRMPEGVPSAVATSFNSLVPGIAVILFFSVVVFILNHMIGLNIPQLIELAIQAPLKAFVLSVPGISFLQFFSDFLWVFGVHGSSILAPIRQVPLLQPIQENMDALSVGKGIPNITTESFTDAFGLIGGGGCILPLVIAILWASERQKQRSITKSSPTTCLFNIAEPIMFGLPVVMNLIYMVPCAIIPFTNLVIVYATIGLGIISKTVVAAPWITPPVIRSFVAIGGDIRVAALTVILIVLDISLFLPFVLATNKAKLTEGGH